MAFIESKANVMFAIPIQEQINMNLYMNGWVSVSLCSCLYADRVSTWKHHGARPSCENHIKSCIVHIYDVMLHVVILKLTINLKRGIALCSLSVLDNDKM